MITAEKLTARAEVRLVLLRLPTATNRFPVHDTLYIFVFTQTHSHSLVFRSLCTAHTESGSQRCSI